MTYSKWLDVMLVNFHLVTNVRHGLISCYCNFQSDLAVSYCLISWCCHFQLGQTIPNGLISGYCQVKPGQILPNGLISCCCQVKLDQIVANGLWVHECTGLILKSRDNVDSNPDIENTVVGRYCWGWEYTIPSLWVVYYCFLFLFFFCLSTPPFWADSWSQTGFLACQLLTLISEQRIRH